MSQKQSFRYLISGGVLGLTTTVFFGASSALFPSASELNVQTSVISKNARATSKSTPSVSPTPTDTATELSSSSPTPAPSSSAPSFAPSGTYEGSSEQVERYGFLQVQIAVEDGVLTDINFGQYPSEDRKSLQISQQVLPWLVEEALSSQSAEVSMISGATYTSLAFKNSLQAALNEAGL